jgi:hypothetical protein
MLLLLLLPTFLRLVTTPESLDKLHPVCLLNCDVKHGHPSFPVWERQSEVIIGNGEMCI